MDAFKAQFERIRQQLAALSATQKMLVAALVAVMVLTVLYSGRYAGNAEMVPVLNQTLTDDDIGPIDHQLELAGVTHTVSGGKILVPADRKDEILSNLMFARVLPQDTHSAFEQMSKDINPFSPNSQVEMAYNEATAMELSSIISRFPGVSNARVIINNINERKIEGSIPPSATVFITTKGDPEHPKDLVRAAADGVAHAVSGLKPSEISVIINGTSMRVPDSANSALSSGDDVAEVREKREADLEQKIRSQFSFIAGLTVTVNCDVTLESFTSQKTLFNRDGTVVQPKETTDTSGETSGASPGSRDVGASANTGAGTNVPISIGDAGGAGGSGSSPNSSTTETHGVKNEIGMGREDITRVSPAGKEIVQSATVRVPDTYFAAIYKLHNPKASEPPADFTATQLASIRDGVKKVVGLKSDDDLSVDTYADLPSVDLMATGPAAPATTLNTVSGHVKEIGIGTLAIVSLLMMATMVRKSAPAPLALANSAAANAAESAAARMNSIGSGESVAGEVGGGAGALDGMEMDEDAVRTQQMLDQVSTMVKENPDGAATLVKKWLSRT